MGVQRFSENEAYDAEKGQMGPRAWIESENLAPGNQDLVLIKGDSSEGLRSGLVTNSRHGPGRVAGNPETSRVVRQLSRMLVWSFGPAAELLIHLEAAQRLASGRLPTGTMM